ncbi:MAG: hypothetical protein RL291_1799 [Pseudomonadota bacterium]
MSTATGDRPAVPLTGRALAEGALCALVAGALWGAVFMAPLLLPSLSALDITSGRYVAYGLFSALMLVIAGRATWPASDVWWAAAKLTFVGNFVYYALTVLGVTRAGAPLTTLIIGVLPVTMAIAGNFGRGGAALPWAHLALPAASILAGLALVHIGEHGGTDLVSTSSATAWLGIAFGVGALAAWTWYGVRNAAYMSARPDVSATTMASLQGVTLLPLALSLLIVSLLAQATHPAGDNTLLRFAVISVLVGIGPTWLAGLLWNRASQLLPAGLLGQLIVFETLFGLLYAFLWRGAWPNWPVALGACLLVLGVLIGLHIFRPKA